MGYTRPFLLSCIQFRLWAPVVGSLSRKGLQQHEIPAASQSIMSPSVWTRAGPEMRIVIQGGEQMRCAERVYPHLASISLLRLQP